MTRSSAPTRFIEQLRDAIAEAIANPVNTIDQHDQCLERIAATLEAVPFVTMCNLANLDVALRGGLLDLLELRLTCVGAGPTLNYADATAFLAGFETMIESARRRRMQ